MNWKIKVNGTFIITVIFALVALFLVVFIHSTSTNFDTVISAESGILKVNENNLKHNIPLTGEWNFYPNAFIDPSSPFELNEVIDVPSPWDENINYGTYRLKITGLTPKKCYSFLIYDMNSAYSFYVDDALIATNGEIADNFTDETMELNPKVVSYNSPSDTVIITLQVSNFHYSPGGIIHDIKIGQVDNIHNEVLGKLSTQILLLGGFIIIGIYNLSLFLLNGKERSAIVFGLFSFAASFRLPFIGERIINVWIPNIDWTIAIRSQFVSGFFVLILFAVFIYCLFREYFSKKFLYLVLSVCTFMIVLTAFISLKTLVILDYTFGIISIVALLYILYVLIYAIKKQATGALFSFVGLSFVIGTLFLDFFLPPGSNIILIGLLIFLIFQSLVISEKYAVIFKQNEILHDVATRDTMTNLYKKEHFTTLVQSILEKDLVEQSHSMLFIDIDNFKFINDTYGHDVGDELIITLSERINRSLRNSDIACRYGGDEFLVWLTQTKTIEAENIAERILKNISEPIQVDDSDITFSVSIGISHYPEDGETPEELVSKSDGRMYKAKSQGKNQFISK